MKPKIILTVVIPAYNMEKYLAKCCQSLVIDENLDRIEVLIVNDGSKDNTLEIAREFENIYNGVFRVADKENGNYGSCVNRGVAEARGEFIKILDADDYFDNKNFNEFVKFLLEISDYLTQVDMVITDASVIDDSGKSVCVKGSKAPSKEIVSMSDITSGILEKLTHHNLTYRTEILRKMNYVQTEGVSYTDQEWVFLPLLSVNHLIYYPRIIYLYLLGREGQTMGMDTYIKNYWMQIVIKKNMLDFYKANKTLYPEVNRKILEALLCRITIRSIYLEFLMKNVRHHDIYELVDFDSYLWGEHPEFYRLSGRIHLNEVLPFRFIEYWRQTQLKFKFVYILYRIYRPVESAVKKIMAYWSVVSYRQP